jgi:hypothetical protein
MPSAKGRGPKPSIPQAKIDEIVDLTKNSKSDGETHWSCRSMGEGEGRGVQGHRAAGLVRAGAEAASGENLQAVERPPVEEKLIDVVGLYLNPPDNAVVLCMDEKSSVQALDRTQPSLPMVPGRCGAQTMTHDSKRHGTTTLFAALNVLTHNHPSVVTLNRD